MDDTKFSRIAESLRQYRRAELKDFETDIAASDPSDALYVDHDEEKRMRAKEVSALINATYQMVGKRTTKLQQMDLVHKDDVEGDMKSEITKKAKSVCFDPDLSGPSPDVPGVDLQRLMARLWRDGVMRPSKI